MDQIILNLKQNDKRKNITYILSIIMGIVQLYMIRFITFPPHVQMTIFMFFILNIVFLVKSSKHIILDLTLILLSSISCIYLIINYSKIITRPVLSTNIEKILTVILIIVVLEASRRCIGPVIAIISIFFLAYAFLGPYLPGLFWHRGFTLNRLASTMYISTNGIFGAPLRVASTMIFTFVLFGSMLMSAGVEGFFTNISRRMASGVTGGPGKVAVIMSGLFGMVSGSSAANVVTTGQLTIPLMKKAGYNSEFAAAVEAAASTGGALMPPIMAAGAFIIAELTEVPYREVVIAGAVPAILFYFGLMISVHFEALKLNLRNVKFDDFDSDRSKSFLWDFHLIIPFLVLIYLIMIYYPVLRAALYSIIVLVVLSIINPKCKYNLSKFLDGIVDGAINSIGVATACACSGIIIGVIGSTGFGLKFSNFILRDGTPYSLAILLTMVIVIILGMGLPGIAAYIVGISVAGPILIRLGAQPLAAHLFVFYFSNMAVITPPVAITAYAASGIANSDPLKTGIVACFLALPAFIIPFIFIQEPALLLTGELITLFRPILSAAAGVFSLSVGIVGYFLTNLRVWNRLIFISGGMCMIAASLATDIIGIGLITVGVLINYQFRKKGETLNGNDNN